MMSPAIARALLMIVILVTILVRTISLSLESYLLHDHTGDATTIRDTVITIPPGTLSAKRGVVYDLGACI